MKYILTCISHNRHENLHNFFTKVGTDDIIFFVKDQNDYDLYHKNGAKNVIISGTLINSRNKSLDYCFNLNSICVQLSDDLENIMINDFTGKYTKVYVNVLDVLNDVLNNFINSQYYLAGFPPTSNPYFTLNEYNYNKFIIGDFIIVKPNDLRFDNNLKLKEDYDYTLQHIKNYGGCIRYGKFLNKFKHYYNKGGAVDYRTDILEQQTIDYLLRKWGRCVKINKKRKNEILLSNNCNKIFNSNQLSLF